LPFSHSLRRARPRRRQRRDAAPPHCHAPPPRSQGASLRCDALRGRPRAEIMGPLVDHQRNKRSGRGGPDRPTIPARTVEGQSSMTVDVADEVAACREDAPSGDCSTGQIEKWLFASQNCVAVRLSRILQDKAARKNKAERPPRRTAGGQTAALKRGSQDTGSWQPGWPPGRSSLSISAAAAKRNWPRNTRFTWYAVGSATARMLPTGTICRQRKSTSEKRRGKRRTFRRSKCPQCVARLRTRKPTML